VGECGHLPSKWKLNTILSESSRRGLFKVDQNLHLFTSSEDPHEDIEALLAKYSSNPESESQLKLLLPHIVSCFGANKSVNKTIEELKKHQLSSEAAGMFMRTDCFIG
jgi:hypothetical protein